MEIEKILDFVGKIYEEKLNALLATAETINKSKTRERQSAEINELASALAKAQGEMEVAHKDKLNPYFKSKYADWQIVVAASRPALSKHGISVGFDFEDINGAAYLVCKVWHSGGQWKESVIRFTPPNSNDVQKVSAYNTYVKRMVYSNATGISIGESDDDGESVVAEQRELKAKGVATGSYQDEKGFMQDVISREEFNIIDKLLIGHDDITEDILKRLKIKNLADIPKNRFTPACDYIIEQKQIRPK